VLEVSSKTREAKARGLNGGFRVEEATGPVPSSHIWVTLGSAVSSPTAVWGGAPAAKRFSCILKAPQGLSENLLSLNFKLGDAVPKLNWRSSQELGG